MNYDKIYKILLIISLALLIGAIVFLTFFYITNRDFINKDVTLTGGTSITIYTEKEFDLTKLKERLVKEIGPVEIRKLKDISTGKQTAIVIETRKKYEDVKEAIEEIIGFKLNEKNSTIEFTGSVLSHAFYKQLLIALLLAFSFMAIVVFIIFRNFIPSIAVILAAVTDLIVTIAIADAIGIQISTAGIGALLMLIGYSVDTDIMLTTKILKRKDKPLNERIRGAFKTGIIMTITSLCAVILAYFISQASILKQIFLMLSIGLIVDIISTWCGNASILKLYLEKKAKIEK